jgi:hypothetical protein
VLKFLYAEKEKQMTKINSQDVLELKIKDLIGMMIEENGTFADFTFREEFQNEVVAFISIGLYETGSKLKEIFNEAIAKLEAEVVDNFEATVGGENNE